MLYKILLHLIFSIVSTAKDESVKNTLYTIKLQMINNMILQNNIWIWYEVTISLWSHPSDYMF